MKPYYLMPWLIGGFLLTEAVLIPAAIPRTSSPENWPENALVGILFAEVSLTLLWAAMVRLLIGWRVALATAISVAGGGVYSLCSRQRGDFSIATAVFGMQAIEALALVGIASLAGMAFGRLHDDVGHARFQTSIVSLLILTTTVAASLSLLKWLVRLEDLEWSHRDLLEFVIVCTANIALMVGLAAVFVGVGRWWFRGIAFAIAVAINAGLFAWWAMAPNSDVVAAWEIDFAQGITLAIGLAVFRACGWRIAWRRQSPAAVAVARPEPVAESPFAVAAQSPGEEVHEPNADSGV